MDLFEKVYNVEFHLFCLYPEVVSYFLNILLVVDFFMK